MDSKIVGNRIKALMQIRNIKRKDLAIQLGISYNTLTKKLNGIREFGISEILEIKEILSLDSQLCADVFFNPVFLIVEQKRKLAN